MPACAEQRFVGHKRDVVIEMDENARRIFDKAFATLDRVRDIEVTERSYSGDPLRHGGAACRSARFLIMRNRTRSAAS